MKRAVYLAAGVAALTLVAGQASAQDWRGAYGGIAAGYGMVDDNEDERGQFDTNLDGNFGDTVRTVSNADAFATGPTPGGFCGGSPKGISLAGGCDDDNDARGEISVRLGYDFQSGPFVYGLVGEFTKSDASDSATAFSITPAQYSFRRDLDTLFAARVRLGYEVGRFLPYVTAGVASASVENRFDTSNTINSFDPIESDEQQTGFQAGGGLETHVTENLRLGVEYVFTSIEDDDGLATRIGRLASPPTGATNPFILVNTNGTDFTREDSDFDLHSLRLTATVSF